MCLANLNQRALILCNQVVLMLCSGKMKWRSCQDFEVTITLAALLCILLVRGGALHWQPSDWGP